MINDDICRHTFLDRNKSQSYFSKLSRFLQQQFFFALHFLRFGPTSLKSVGHRAGYPIKSVKNKDTHTIHIHYWPLWHTLKSTTTTIITRHYDKKLCNSSQVFLGGWTRLRILPLPVSPRTSWIETAFNNWYKFTAITHLVKKKRYFF